MIKIKICGIQNEIEADYVNQYLPDYTGFVFAQSKRRVSIEKASLIASKLDTRIKKTGVFVNEDVNVIIRTAQECHLDVIQLHGDETSDFILELKEKFINERLFNEDQLSQKQFNEKQLYRRQREVAIWKAVRVKDSDSIRTAEEFKEVDCLLLDTYCKNSYGGVGRAFPWELAADVSKCRRVIIAGGLTMQNVRNAIEIVKPFAIDVSSGVETDGLKDKLKIRDFIKCVREMR